MTALRHDTTNDDVDETLDAVVARIKASGRGHVLPAPPADAVIRLIAQVAQEPTMSQQEEAAWNLAWAHVIDQIRQRDHDDDIAEGRG